MCIPRGLRLLQKFLDVTVGGRGVITEFIVQLSHGFKNERRRLFGGDVIGSFGDTAAEVDGVQPMRPVVFPSIKHPSIGQNEH